VLEREKYTEDTEAKIRQLKDKIEKHNKVYRMESFHTKDTRGNNTQGNNSQGNRRKRGDGGAGATDSAELGAHGYEIEPRDFVDDSGIVYESFSSSNVRQPLCSYAPR
jgi:hypothetical protein